jgi:hypothetical protein
VARVDREHILAEIRRCAFENDGVPVGRDRFEALTDIRESEWLGRYWVRWGDALQEAGFEPNILQGRVHDDEDLVRHLAVLTRALGHFPTHAERQMRRHSDLTFPSANTFNVRLGTRDAQVALIVNFAAANDEFADLLDLLPAVAAEARFTEALTTSTGFVYLVRSSKFHKIGWSSDLGRRSYELALQLPERLELVHAFETDDPQGIEKYWHQRFADRRANGEWFSLTKADIAAFKRRRRFM